MSSFSPINFNTTCCGEIDGAIDGAAGGAVGVGGAVTGSVGVAGDDTGGAVGGAAVGSAIAGVADTGGAAGLRERVRLLTGESTPLLFSCAIMWGSFGGSRDVFAVDADATAVVLSHDASCGATDSGVASLVAAAWFVGHNSIVALTTAERSDTFKYDVM
jgi:hypothetical protein